MKEVKVSEITGIVNYIKGATGRKVLAIEMTDMHYSLIKADKLLWGNELNDKKIGDVEIRINNEVEWPTYIYNDVTIDKKPNPYFGVGEIETI